MCNGSVKGAASPHIVDNTGRRQLALGVEDFESVLQGGVYVDKTMLLRDLATAAPGRTFLFCRPRRFGKSLAMRMVQFFFEAPVEGYVPDRGGLFENLAVREAGTDVWAERGTYPVIRLNLASVDGESWEDMLAVIERLVAAEYVRHTYVYDGPAITPFEKPVFERLATATAGGADVKGSLARLSNLLARHHGSKTVIVIDEYDKPITASYLGGWRERATTFMRAWLTDALKGTGDLRLACLTGVQRVGKESIFSDLNNLVVNTALDSGFDEAFGFTEEEAVALAGYMGHGDGIDEMRAWYDGYCFGGTRVYNPISTLSYLQSGETGPYWVNTSGNGVVTRLVQHADVGVDADLRTLAQGGTVEKPLDLAVVFGEIESDTNAIWSQLYLAGYLTTDDVEMPTDHKRPRCLRTPNYEIRDLLDYEFIVRARRIAHGDGRLDLLHDSLVAADEGRMGFALAEIVENAPSFRDLTTEAACHMLLMGMLYDVSGYRYPVSNRESGRGISDILLEPKPEATDRLPAIAVEVKRLPKDDFDGQESLYAHARDVALAQAIEKDYGSGLAGRGRVLWGVTFCGKHVAVAARVVA